MFEIPQSDTISSTRVYMDQTSLVAQEYMDVPKRIHGGQVNMAKNNTIPSEIPLRMP